jgi:hypothetical protein
MKTRWMAVSAFVLGMAAAPLAFQIIDNLHRTATAQAPVLADVPEPLVFPAIAQPKWPEATATGNSGAPSILRPSPLGTLEGSVVNQVLQGSHINLGDFNFSMEPLRALQTTKVGIRIDQPVREGFALEDDLQCLNIVLVGNTVDTTFEPKAPDLSKQYIELSSQLARLKLKRMHSTLLALEVETLKKELSDQEAACKLEELQEQLKKLVSDHPESPAAQSAKRMLEGGVISTAFPAGLVPVNTLPTY